LLNTSCAFDKGNSSRVTTFSSVPPKFNFAIVILFDYTDDFLISPISLSFIKLTKFYKLRKFRSVRKSPSFTFSL
jgi:hypothetical protein